MFVVKKSFSKKDAISILNNVIFKNIFLKNILKYLSNNIKIYNLHYKNAS